MFKAELWDPDAWANLFKDAGAKCKPNLSSISQKLPSIKWIHCAYTADVVLTSKHHEGWCNFKNSYHWNWNSVDEGPKRDLVGDLTNSVRKAGLRMGLYHSLREWYNPAYIAVRPSPLYFIWSSHFVVLLWWWLRIKLITAQPQPSWMIFSCPQWNRWWNSTRYYSVLSEQLFSHSYPTMGGTKSAWKYIGYIYLKTRYCCCTAGGDMGRWCRRQSVYTQLHQVLEGSSIPQLALQW